LQMTTGTQVMTDGKNSQLISLTADIVTAYVSNNRLDEERLSELIPSVYSTMESLLNSKSEENRPKPAVPVKKSINEDYLVCLEDGKKLKMLKRYLKTRYDMSPEEYRTRWGLPADYPMVAPSYAARRSDFAKKIGLGKKK